MIRYAVFSYNNRSSVISQRCLYKNLRHLSSASRSIIKRYILHILTQVLTVYLGVYQNIVEKLGKEIAGVMEIVLLKRIYHIKDLHFYIFIR